MRGKRTSIELASLKAFVEDFSAEFGRSERRTACVAYLANLLFRKNGGADTSMLTLRQKNRLRHFVNRSAWSHTKVLQRLQTLVFEQASESDGALVLTEIKLRKQGRNSVGCDRQSVGFHQTRLHDRLHINCQSVLVWSWVTGSGVWPLAARLFLPPTWTLNLPRAHAAQIPAQFHSYQTKTQIALALLDEIRSQLPKDCPLLMDENFTQEWELFAELSRRGESYVARLEPRALWPINSLVTEIGLPREHWNPIDQRLHLRASYPWVKRALAASRLSRLKHSTQHIPAAKQPLLWKELLGFERYLFQHSNPNGLGGFYLFNKRAREYADLINASNHIGMARDTCDELKESALRHFEGRKWLGFHNHVTLCFMAHHFTLKKKLQT